MLDSDKVIYYVIYDANETRVFTHNSYNARTKKYEICWDAWVNEYENIIEFAKIKPMFFKSKLEAINVCQDIKNQLLESGISLEEIDILVLEVVKESIYRVDIDWKMK